MIEGNNNVEFNKVIRDGMVAILYSPGYGAGWSTWCGHHKEFLMFDSVLVSLAENKATQEQVEEYLKEKLCDKPPYCGGWEGIEIAWVKQGTPFEIAEYDGSERIREYNASEWTIA